MLMIDNLQITTFVSSESDLCRAAQSGPVREVLLEPELCAKQGALTLEEAERLAVMAGELGLRAVLVWDILMPENVMKDVCETLSKRDLSVYEAIRVRDPGAAPCTRQRRGRCLVG